MYMYINIVKRYLMLADSGIFEQHVCKSNSEHGRLYPNIDLEDKVFIYCLYCSYKEYLGFNTIKKMQLSVMNYDINSDLRHLAGLE